MKRTKLDIVKQVVKENQYTKIKMFLGAQAKARSVILDTTTASRILRLFMQAPVSNIDKINALSWDRLVNLAWSPSNANKQINVEIDSNFVAHVGGEL